MKKLNKFLYLTGGLLAVAGLLLKMTHKPYWEYVLIAAAAALAGNIILDMFGSKS